MTVKTARATYTADRLVITAGPWASRVLSELGFPLTVLRKVLFWIGTEDDSQFRRNRFPIYMAQMQEGFFYGFPVIDRDGAKLARHDGGKKLIRQGGCNVASGRRRLPGIFRKHCRNFSALR